MPDSYVDPPAFKPRFADLSDCQLRYLKQGRGTTSILLVHGFMGNLHNWALNQRTLAAGYEVYAVELPGHGRSSKQVPDPSIDGLISTVIEFLDAVGRTSVHLVGHSLGGGLGLGLALREPERVSTCTLLAPIGFGREIATEFAEGVLQTDSREQIRHYLGMLFGDRHVVTRAMVEDVIRYKNMDGVIPALRKIFAEFTTDGVQALQLRDRIVELSMPLQVMWGAEDRILPSFHAEGLPDHVEVHRFARCGHMLQMEVASDVNRLVRLFIEQ